MGEEICASPQPRAERAGALTQPFRRADYIKYPADSGESDTLDVGKLIGTLRRRKLIILSIIAVMTAAAVAVISRLTPIYEADAFVIVGTEKPNLINPEDSPTRSWDSTDAIQTEIQILNSNSLAREVIESQKLDQSAEFNPLLAQPDAPPSAIDRAATWVRALIHGFPSAAGDPENDLKFLSSHKEAEQAAVVRAFKEHLGLSNAGKSRVIKISFSSESAATAAAVANELAIRYIARQHQIGQTAYSDALDWYSQRLADAQVGRIKAQRELTGALTDALATGQVTSVDDVLNSNLIRDLKVQQATVEQRVASLSERYGSSYPELKAARRELASVTEKIRTETRNILDQLIRDGAQSQINLEKTTALLAKTDNGPALDALAHQAAAQELIYKNLLMRFNELKMQDGVQSANSEILSTADIPANPSFPHKTLLLLLSIIVATACAIPAALVLEACQHTILSSNEVEQQFGVETLALVPRVRSLHGAKAIGDSFSSHSARASFGNSIRNLHLKLLMNPAPPRTILVTSTAPGEGKTSLAVALSILLAKTGRKTVIVDCDMRRPAVHSAFNASLGTGLSNYLCGTAALDDVIRSDDATGVSVIPAGESHPHPGDLLRSHRMTELLETLKVNFDAIILDSPPIRAVPDALLIAPQIEATLFVIRWGKTPPKGIARALGLFSATGAPLAGVALSQVDVKKIRQHGLDDYYEYGALHYGHR